MGFQRILLALGLLWATLAGATEVSDVTFTQSTDGSKRVIVQYTLSGDTSDVSLDLSLDGGISFQRVLEGARGDIGMNVPPGSRSIEVDLAALGNLATTSAQFRVVALMNPVISEQVVVVDTLQTQVMDVGENTVTFLLAHPDSLGMEVDDILVGTASQPFLRRVVHIDQNGNQVIVTTSPATLVEVLQQGELHESFQLADSTGGLFSLQVNYLAPGVAVLRDQRSLSLSGVVLFEGEHEGVGVSLTIPNGIIDFTPDIDFDMVVEDLSLQEFRLTAGGALQFDCDLLVQVSASVSMENEVLLASFSKWTTFLIGWVPVLVKTTLDFHGGAEVELEAEASMQTGFDSNTEIEVGASYETGDGWQPVYERDTDFNEHPLEWEVDGTAEVRAYVRPSVSVELYGVAGPFLATEPYLRFAGEVQLPGGWSWDLYGGVYSQLGFLVTVIEDTLAEYSWQSPAWEMQIANAEGQFNQPPEAPHAPIPADQAQHVSVTPLLSWQCSDPDEDELEYDVYLGTSPDLGDEDLVSEAQLLTECAPDPLPNGTTHYWMIVVRDQAGHEVTSPPWSFSTLSGSGPEVPHSPWPSDGATGVAVDPLLLWSCADPDGDTVLFDVYMSDSNELTPDDLIAEALFEPQLQVTQLDLGTTYYWRVLARDDDGHESIGPVWAFTTSQGQSADSLFVLVPAGDFMMGQAGVATPVHSVTLTHNFMLGRTEVTNQQYIEAAQWAYDQGMITATSTSVTGYSVELLEICDDCEISFNNNLFIVYPGREQYPVTHVTWYGAASYCDWRSLMNGLPAYYNGQWSQIPSPSNPYTATGYRLPTEAEWEFAAQYDDERSYPWGNTAPTECVHANFIGCTDWTAPVGSFSAGDNELGLKDMAGNVWEWCNDWWANYSSGAVSDPIGPAANAGYGRVVRGGSWYANWFFLSCAYRDGDTDFDAGCGFRLCRTP